MGRRVSPALKPGQHRLWATDELSIELQHSMTCQILSANFRQDVQMRHGLLVLNSEQRVIFCSEDAARLMELGQDEFLGIEIEEVFHQVAQVNGITEFRENLAATISSALAEPTNTTLILPRPGLLDLAVTAFTIPLKRGEQLIAVAVSDVNNEKQEERKWGATIAIISHEIYNLLTIIYSYTDMLLHSTPLNATQRQWLETIRSDGERITDLVSGLSQAVGLDSTAASVRTEHLSIRDTVDNVTTNLTAAYSGHYFDTEVPRDLPEGLANRIDVEQILKNLVENAIKYSPQGGRVSIAAHHQPESQHLVISVGDQGIGISQGDWDRIFLLGERIARSETDDIVGSGLGLFIVKELVELMGGEVWVKSELGLGSTFYFTLPAA